jgi:hypothetical protein
MSVYRSYHKYHPRLSLTKWGMRDQHVAAIRMGLKELDYEPRHHPIDHPDTGFCWRFADMAAQF